MQKGVWQVAIPNPYQTPAVKKTTVVAAVPKPQVSTSSAVTPKSVPNPQITPEQSSAQSWINSGDSGQGGLDAYTKTQNDRWKTANASNDADMMNRLQSDSKRVGYVLDPYNPPGTNSVAAPQTAVSSTAASTSTPAPNTAPPSAYTDWQAKQNELMAKYESLMSASFQYDPATDPRYQAAQQLAKSRADAAAKDANSATLEEMNNRGILNSSVTASQLSQNENKYKQQAETEALSQIPAFYSEARSDYQDKLKNAANMLNFAAGRGDTAYQNEYTQNRDARNDQVTDRNYDRGVLESDRGYDRGVTESDRNFDRGVVESDRNYDRGVLESDRGYDLQKAAQDWDQNFSQEQFDWNKAQQTWENAFQEKNFQQQMEEAASSRGLQWATLSQRDKEFIADEAWKQKEYDLTKGKQDAETQTKSFESDVLNELGTFENSQDATGWLKENAAEITRQLGTDGLVNLQKMLPSLYGEGKDTTSDVRQKAAEMAMKDTVAWTNAKTPEKREALINEYMKYFQ